MLVPPNFWTMQLDMFSGFSSGLLNIWDGIVKIVAMDVSVGVV